MTVTAAEIQANHELPPVARGVECALHCLTSKASEGTVGNFAGRILSGELENGECSAKDSLHESEVRGALRLWDGGADKKMNDAESREAAREMWEAFRNAHLNVRYFEGFDMAQAEFYRALRNRIKVEVKALGAKSPGAEG